MRLLFIGEAPSRPMLPEEQGRFDAGSSLRVAQWAGRSPEEMRAVAQWQNLFLVPMQPWKAHEARVIAENWWPVLRDMKYGRVVLLGERVAAAFAFDEPAFAWFAWRNGPKMAWMPHTSGRNRYWNDPANVQRAQRFLRCAVTEVQ